MNRIYLIGNLVHSPELRTTQSGKTVCSFSIAVNRRFKDQDGKRQTDFFNVQVWGAQAAPCANYLEKGRKVAVTGAMQSRQYDGKDGTRKTAWDVVADEVEFLTPRSEADKGQTEPDAAAQRNGGGFDPITAGFTLADDEPLPF